MDKFNKFIAYVCDILRLFELRFALYAASH